MMDRLSESGFCRLLQTASRATLIVAVVLLAANPVVGQAAGSAVSCSSSVPCSDCWLSDSHRLTGDWGGLRSDLEDRGWAFNLFNTQFYQGVASGGLEQEWAYGGKLDYLIDLDGEKSGLWEGLFVNFHAETRYGEDVNVAGGLLTPSNVVMGFPDPNSHVTAITGLKVTQAVSENLAFFAGKINTLQEYPLKYSPGPITNLPGLAGFMNTSLVFNPIMGRTVPYSTFGAGAAYLAKGFPIASLSAFDPRERATDGINKPYGEGVTIVPNLLLPTQLFGRPGVMNLGGAYSSADYRSVDPDAWLDLPPEVIAAGGPVESESWALYANLFQSVWVDSQVENRGWGLFAQFGISDGNPNPVQFVANGGVAGRSMLAGRTLDTFGVGYFYLGLSDNFTNLVSPFIELQDEQGIEVFYNYAVTPWCRLTCDLQVVDSSVAALDTSIITGLRLQTIF
jgi:porin